MARALLGALGLLLLYLLLEGLGLPRQAASVLLGGAVALLGFALGPGAGGLGGLLAGALDTTLDPASPGLAADLDHLLLALAYLGLGYAAGRLGEALRFRGQALALLYRASRELSRLRSEEEVLKALPDLLRGLGGEVGVYRAGDGAFLGPEGLRPLAERALGEGPLLTPKALALPLAVEGEPVAVLVLASRQALRPALLPLLQSFAELTAEALARRRALRRLQEMAYTDPLTGLLSRRAFEERLREEWARALREGRPLGLLLLDLDGFKGVNDTRGHAEGDRLLKRVAEALRRAKRESDLLFRWGGDEFAVLLPGTEAEGAGRAGARYREAVREGTGLGVSLGYAGSDEGHPGPEALLRAADKRLYRAKESKPR